MTKEEMAKLTENAAVVAASMIKNMRENMPEQLSLVTVACMKTMLEDGAPYEGAHEKVLKGTFGEEGAKFIQGYSRRVLVDRVRERIQSQGKSDMK